MNVNNPLIFILPGTGLMFAWWLRRFGDFLLLQIIRLWTYLVMTRSAPPHTPR